MSVRCAATVFSIGPIPPAVHCQPGLRVMRWPLYNWSVMSFGVGCRHWLGVGRERRRRERRRRERRREG